MAKFYRPPSPTSIKAMWGRRRRVPVLPLFVFCLGIMLSFQIALLFRAERRYDYDDESSSRTISADKRGGSTPTIASSSSSAVLRGGSTGKRSRHDATAVQNRFVRPDGGVGEYIMYSNDEAYFKACRVSMLTNDTWGEERAPLVDKIVSKKLTEAMAIPDLKVIPTYRTFHNVSDIESGFTLELLRSLPQPYMIKASHTSGGIARVYDDKYQHLKPGKVRKPMTLNEKAFKVAKERVILDMGLDFAVVAGEPQYKFLQPAILIEEDILTIDKSEGDSRTDVHNYYVAGGRVVFVSYQCAPPESGKLASYHAPRIWVSARFEKLPMKLGKAVCPFDLEKPANWDTQVAIAEGLAKHMPHPGIVRIDLYANERDVYFSEFTFSSAACQYDFSPRAADGLLYAAGHGQIPPGEISASFVEGVIADRSWALASLYDVGFLNPVASGAYPSPVDLCADLTLGETRRKKRRTAKGTATYDSCIGAAKKASVEPFRCVVSEENGEKVTSFGAPLRPTVASIAEQLNPFRVLLLVVVACALTYFNVGTKHESNQYRNNTLYLLGLGMAVYATTSDIEGLYSGRSPYLLAKESFVAFRNVHPMTSPAIALSHFATYWFQVAAWRSKSVRNMVVWRILSEVVTGAVNEYTHHLERQSEVRCMRLAFIGAMHNYVYDNILREFIVPPFFVYFYLLPTFVCHWSMELLGWLCFWC